MRESAYSKGCALFGYLKKFSKKVLHFRSPNCLIYRGGKSARRRRWSAAVTQAEKRLSDEELVESIYREHCKLMFAVARKYTRNDSICEDIVQDCLVKLMQRPDELRDKDEQTAARYVAAMVKNAAVNRIEHQRVVNSHTVPLRKEDDSRSMDRYDETELTLDERVIALDDARLLYEALRHLSDSDRILLEGKYILDMTDEELALQLNCGTNSVRMKLTRARRRAKDKILALSAGGD